jgi:hypothetical protein
MLALGASLFVETWHAFSLSLNYFLESSIRQISQAGNLFFILRFISAPVY